MYHDLCCTLPVVEAIDISQWVKTMEQIAKDTYEGKLKKGELSEDYIRKTYAELEDAAQKGYGKNWLKVDKATGMPNKEVVMLQRNIWKFSGAKNYAVLLKINHLLTQNGKPAPWKEFRKEVLKLNATYNKNYLQAEWQTAKQAAKMAANWEAYQRNTDLYPNLEYRTQKDGRVRDAHKPLHGVVAPIDSDFWKSHYPPNGWRCRCYVVQTAAKPTKDIPKISEKDHPLEFRGNVGISGEIFKETEANKGKPHPYFALANTADNETKKAFEYSKLAAPLNKVYTAKNGATVKVSPFADEKDWEDNVKSAIKMADNGLNIEILAHVNPGIIKGKSNPEYTINNTVGDLKINFNQDNYDGVGNCFKAAKKQGVKCIAIDLSKAFKNIQISKLYRVINGKITKKRGKWIDFIVIINGDVVQKISREDVLDNKLLEKLKALK